MTITVIVFNTSPWVFTTGEAAVSGDATVYDPISGELFTKSAAPKETQIVRHAVQPDPKKSAQPTRDPRFSRT